METRDGRVSAAPKGWIEKTVVYLLEKAKRKRPMGIGTTFDPRKIVGEAVFIYAAFWWTPWHTKIAILTVAFATLRLRDLRIHPAEGTPEEAATDVLIMSVAVILSQIWFSVKMPAFATGDSSDFMRGIAISLVSVAGWRFAFQVGTPKNDPQQQPELRVYRSAARLNLMFLFAVILLAAANPQSVPGGSMRDRVWAIATLLPIVMMKRLAKKTEHSMFWETAGMYSIGTDFVGLELEAKADTLYRLVPNSPEARKILGCQIVFVLSLLSPVAVAFWRLGHGQAWNVEWHQLTSNLIAIIILLPVWRILTEFNAATADMMEQAIVARQERGENQLY